MSLSAAGARRGPVGIGVIGAGVISKTYLENLGGFADTHVLAIGDIVAEAAASRAAEFGVPNHGGIDAVLRHDAVEIVVNLTTPAAHAEVATNAILAGKHVFNEKPLTLDRATGAKLLDAAASAGLRIGCAPDTFLGSGLQAARRLLDEGVIGTPLSALALMQGRGPESWHPNPAFLFQDGAGPLFDVGPYYLTALVQTFGPVAAIASLGSRSREQRVVGSGPKAGEPFDVTVPTHVGSLARFESGQSFQSIFSFDSALSRTLLEINGTEGTLLMPDPNTFAGEIKVRRIDGEDWELLEETTALSSRGTGVLDLARAIRENRPHRAQGALAYHVLDVMATAYESAESGEFLQVQSTVERADLLPADWDPKEATL